MDCVKECAQEGRASLPEQQPTQQVRGCHAGQAEQAGQQAHHPLPIAKNAPPQGKEGKGSQRVRLPTTERQRLRPGGRPILDGKGLVAAQRRGIQAEQPQRKGQQDDGDENEERCASPPPVFHAMASGSILAARSRASICSALSVA